MTKEEAMQNIQGILDEATEEEDSVCYVTSNDAEALRMAIEALRHDVIFEQKAEYIISSGDVMFTSAVVRCKDCKYYDASLEVCRCSQWDLSRIEYPMVDADGFCSFGERG